MVKRGNQALVLSVAERSDVNKITANYPIELVAPVNSEATPVTTAEAVGSNLSFIQADQVWNKLGVTGEGSVSIH